MLYAVFNVHSVQTHPVCCKNKMNVFVRLGDQAVSALIKAGLKGNVYQHYKGGLYRITGVATNATDGCNASGDWIIYKTLKTTNHAANPVGKQWCRHASDFFAYRIDAYGYSSHRFVKKPKN